MSESTKQAAAGVRQQREGVYGSPAITLECLAQHWTALLRSHFQDEPITHVPSHMVGLMLALLKIHRAANPFPKKDADSYVDCRNYLDFAMESDLTLPSRSAASVTRQPITRHVEDIMETASCGDNLFQTDGALTE